ncbi:MAG: HvfC/BufC family peptide modification chaperone [Burkholderiales bacterium]
MNTPTPGALARFQDAFAHALLAPDAEPAAEVAALTAQPAFAVYRNTVMKGCIDALRANYPTVVRLVGDECFRAAAAIYVREALPTDPTLLRYGAGFADFLAHFKPAAKLTYLPGVARLDRFWTEAHAAPNDDALDPAAVAGLELEALAGAVLQPHPAARWAWFGDGPIYTIWSRNRTNAPANADLDWCPEGALLARPRDAVEWIELDAAGCAFLDACAAGETLAEAAHSALRAQCDADLTHLMSTLLEAGAFSSMTFNNSQPLTRVHP